jgi:hypothetical protein
MKCEDRQIAISMMIDNECPEDMLPGLFAHLGGCSSCLQFYRETIDLRTRLHRERVPAVRLSLDARVLSQVIKRKIIRIPGWVTSRVTVPVPLAAAALVVLVLGVWSLIGHRAIDMPPADREIVYVTTLPAVEVEGTLPGTSPEPK